MVVALALCLLLLGGFSVDAAGRINGNCVHSTGKCLGDLDCSSQCRDQGYSSGSCTVKRSPSSKLDKEIRVNFDYQVPGDCCCLN
ncbi:hypothetical protein MKW94_012398 [Papaver nudicaule]|uniref:Uncharacterized protein n=1 Tax=Papaver nudicaule TaxID=74823 RepID=A0AA41VCY6_PAPNU|nr:hypothetical protein [Papaver nudicaule]